LEGAEQEQQQQQQQRRQQRQQQRQAVPLSAAELAQEAEVRRRAATNFGTTERDRDRRFRAAREAEVEVAEAAEVAAAVRRCNRHGA
jgi:hypothetical protein